MIPPKVWICRACEKEFESSTDGWALYESSPDAPMGLYAAWFCKKHYEEALSLQKKGLTFSQLISNLKKQLEK